MQFVLVLLSEIVTSGAHVGAPDSPKFKPNMFCRANPVDAISASSLSLLRSLVILMVICLVQLGFTLYTSIAKGSHYSTFVPTFYSMILLLGFTAVRRRSPCLLKAYYIVQSLALIVSTGLLTGYLTYLAVANPKLVDTAVQYASRNPVVVGLASALFFIIFISKVRSIFYARVLSIQLTMQTEQAIELANLDDDEENVAPKFYVVPQSMFAPANGQEALYMQVPAHANLVPIYVDRSGNLVQ